jgi:mRNA-degrading endonuclease RelE of RelBE toxin-antitoxin system
MKNKIFTLPVFDSRYKRFSKKFPSLEGELLELKAQLLKNPKTGTLITENIYKIRLASLDKNSGKSGGFRIVTYLVEENTDGFDINLLLIYDKSEESTIKKTEIIKIIKKYF